MLGSVCALQTYGPIRGRGCLLDEPTSQWEACIYIHTFATHGLISTCSLTISLKDLLRFQNAWWWRLCIMWTSVSSLMWRQSVVKPVWQRSFKYSESMSKLRHPILYNCGLCSYKVRTLQSCSQDRHSAVPSGHFETSYTATVQIKWLLAPHNRRFKWCIVTLKLWEIWIIITTLITDTVQLIKTNTSVTDCLLPAGPG